MMTKDVTETNGETTREITYDWANFAHRYLGFDHPAHLGVSCLCYQEGERPEPSGRVPTIALDFDGVIHAYSRGWHDGTIYDELMPGAVEGMRELLKNYAVFIFTARSNLRAVADYVRDRLGVPVSVDHPEVPRQFWSTRDIVYVTGRKLPAVAYVDDRGVRFTSWDDVFEQLEHLDD